MPSNDAMQFTLTLKMHNYCRVDAEVAKTSAAVNSSPIQDYTHLDDPIPPTYKILSVGYRT